VSLEQGLESARCAYINLHNMVKMMPALNSHPLLFLVEAQLREAIVQLDDEDGQAFCGNEWPAKAKEAGDAL